MEYSSASNIRASVEPSPPPFNRLNKLLYSPPALLSLTFYEILPQAYRLFTVPYISVRSKVVRSALRAAILVSNVTSSASGYLEWRTVWEEARKKFLASSKRARPKLLCNLLFQS